MILYYSILILYYYYSTKIQQKNSLNKEGVMFQTLPIW